MARGRACYTAAPFWKGKTALSREMQAGRPASPCAAAPSRYPGAMLAPGETSAERLLAFPGMRRVPAAQIELFHCPGFLPPALCESLVELIDANRRPSTIADPNGDAYFRTSETCDLDGSLPEIRSLEGFLQAASAIDPAHGEPPQGQRYDVGQEFKPHTDYFEPGGQDFERYCAVAGQRSWTLMVYLNDVEAGGGTRFRHIGKTFQPRAGMMLAWNNRLPGGQVNPATLHHGMKVRRGVKYIVTKWYRERAWGL